MAGLKAFGRHSVASLLDIAMIILIVLGWAGFIFSAAVLAFAVFIDLSGGEFVRPGFEGYVPVTTGTYFVGIAILFIVFTGIILMARQLRRILKTLIAGDPFVPENAGRLRSLALIVAGMEIARSAIGLAARLLDMPVATGFPVNLAAWVAVIILWVLAHVFAEGARLREEEKMTI